MKRIIFTFIGLLLFSLNFLIAQQQAENKLIPGLVVFIDNYITDNNHYNLLELNDARERCESFYDSARNKITKRSKVLAGLIAKELGAVGILGYDLWHVDYYPWYTRNIDPKYDITQRVVDRINKEYSEEIESLKKQILSLSSAQLMLYKSIENNYPEGIKQAVAKGAHINFLKDGMSVMVYALIFKSPNAITTLLELGIKVDEKLIEKAFQLDDIKSAILFSKKCGANLNKVYTDFYGVNYSLLQKAISKHDIKSVIELIRSGVDYTTNFKLNGEHDFKSVLYNHLLSNIRDSNNVDDFIALLQEIINRGMVENINDLLFNNESDDCQIYSYKEIVEFLIKNGANPNYISPPIKNMLARIYIFSINVGLPLWKEGGS